MNTFNKLTANYRKGRRCPITTAVIHYTGSDSATAAVNWFYTPKSKVSAHYVISKEGVVFKCVNTSNEAWHAGVSYGPNGLNVNKYSIGIELAGTGDGFPRPQMESLEKLLKELKQAIPSIKWLTGHDQICLPKGRKTDPGPNFHLLNTAGSCGYTVWLRGDGKQK